MKDGTKRAREEEKADLTTDGLLVKQLLKADPEKLARVGRKDEQVLSELSNFIDKFRASIENVKKARTDEQKAIHQARSEEVMAQMKEKKNKMIEANQCFKCKKYVDNLNPCVGFKEEGVSGNGVLVCDDCLDGVCEATCKECLTFLCRSCCDLRHFNCDRCNGTVCLPCMDKDGYAGRSCDCDEWFCAKCVDRCVEEEQCVSCSQRNTFCCHCSYKDQMPRCKGLCHQPLCDDCVRTHACGNDARLYGHCDYDCAQVKI